MATGESINVDNVYFHEDARESFYRVIRSRRDMRHFLAGAKIDEAVFSRILNAAHHAPSVGLMQPWRFIRITETVVRENIYQLVVKERNETAHALGERSDDFMRLKVEGIRECAELLIVAMAPDDGTVFGRRTMPREMAMCSVACAIQNLWLAARVENIGMGWVSMFEPRALSALLKFPAGAYPLAILCLGPVQEFYPIPMLELEAWRKGRPLNELLFENHWE